MKEKDTRKRKKGRAYDRDIETERHEEKKVIENSKQRKSDKARKRECEIEYARESYK
jgi:hypothetical protein